MEQLLHKIARQLDALDEASLMNLWDKYAGIVGHFEPTKRWEEAALVLSLIQAKHWKNQLFNQRFAASASPSAPQEQGELPAFLLKQPEEAPAPAHHHARILEFKPAQQSPSAETPENSEQ